MTTLLSESARGVYPIMATPFTAEGEIAWPSVDRLLDFYLAGGVNGLTILGIMGEATKLSAGESETFATRCLGRIAGRLPVVVGASSLGVKPLGNPPEGRSTAAPRP